MNQEIFNKLKKELIEIAAIFVGLVLIAKIIMIQENMVTLIRVIISLFWLFIIPGYFIMVYWVNKINFFSRAILGIFLSAAILGISSYYLGIMGINIKVLHIVLPIILIIIGLFILYRKLKE